jgi:NADH-quinone oxidoreductase subunit F
MSKALTSIGPANLITRTEETHPLTWRLRDDGQPVWLDEYQAKNGYAAARKALGEWPRPISSRPSKTQASKGVAVQASPPA